MAEIEYGKCEICGKEGPLQRTYFRYPDIKCECHSPYHFDLVIHCDECVPTQPEYTKISVRTDRLDRYREVVRCKDCEYYEPYSKPVEDFDGRCIIRECETDENDFCNYGRKENE